MNYFLSGGAKNGKSSLAQEIVCAQSGPRYYLATMIPHDDEDRLRIQRHLDNRAGMGFQTVECGTDILSSLSRMEPDGAVLLDSVTALLSNEMFRAEHFVGRHDGRLCPGASGGGAAGILPPDALLRVRERLYLR